MTAALADAQHALLQVVLSPRGESTTTFIANYVDLTWTLAQRGLKTYRANGQALAERALAAAYPVAAHLLGAESFAALARALWHHHPPQRGDMGGWGDALPGFIAAAPQLADEPYLSDVARAEWALHTAATAADGAPAPTTWGLLATHDPAELSLQLAPGTALVDSAWPVFTLLAAHDGRTTLSEAAERLHAGVPECALVWRDGLRPRVRAALPGEAAFVGAALNGATLADALSAAPDCTADASASTPFDFAAWLPLAAQSGLLVGVARVPSLSLPTACEALR
jgi:Putative DNA-binding domain